MILELSRIETEIHIKNITFSENLDINKIHIKYFKGIILTLVLKGPIILEWTRSYNNV